MKSKVNIVLIGPPGSGKGSQAEVVSDYMHLQWIKVGDILRKESRKNTSLAKKIDKAIDAGKLVPSKLVVDLVTKELKNKKKGIMFDGFPRDLYEAKKLEKLVNIDLVFLLKVPKSLIVARLKNRRMCPNGHAYNLLTKKPKNPGYCDVDSEKLYMRDDDQPKAIKQRIKIFEEETKKVIDFYKKKGIVHELDASDSIRKVFLQVKKIIREVANG